MKNEWKPEQLRATSEEIRGAVMPKSITPDMVGGTLLGVVNALGEVVEVLGGIPRGHVKVKVEATDGTHPASAAGAVVYVDTFCVGGIPTQSFPRQEYEVDENCEVEFDIPIGCKFAVYSKLMGFGASPQHVYEATYEPREVILQHFPVGIWWAQVVWIAREDDEGYGEMRILTFSNYVTDWESEEMQSKLGAGELFDDSTENGIIVSTPETCFMLPKSGSLSEERMEWCKPKDYRNEFITLPGVWYDGANGEELTDAENKARADMDGNLNTAKILAHATDAPAAGWCAGQDQWKQVYLPSAGQLSLMQENRTAINALMTAANADGCSYKLLPYQNAGGQWQLPNGHHELWWSSTRSTFGRSWDVYYDGRISYSDSDSTRDVRAVMAFHFEY